jgi:hypothetical protein
LYQKDTYIYPMTGFVKTIPEKEGLFQTAFLYLGLVGLKSVNVLLKGFWGRAAVTKTDKCPLRRTTEV